MLIFIDKALQSQSLINKNRAIFFFQLKKPSIEKKNYHIFTNRNPAQMGCQKLQYYSAQIPFYLWNPEPVKERAENVVQMWLSVDPMADKYPNLSPYNYCMNNPIMLIDPNGDS
ncbi:MAG: hypothetical protein CVU14_10755, partial [Bacteroidetes bacterium HGW-Bacteroidetes-9]